MESFPTNKVLGNVNTPYFRSSSGFRGGVAIPLAAFHLTGISTRTSGLILLGGVPLMEIFHVGSNGSKTLIAPVRIR